MKHLTAVVALCCAVLVMVALRRTYQARLLRWSARRAGSTPLHGRARALVAHGTVFTVALVLTVAGFWAWARGGTVANARYPAAVVVLLGYVPAASVAAPKLTRWQRSHEQRLLDAGAVRGAAREWDRVARVFSVLSVVLGFGALFLIVTPT